MKKVLTSMVLLLFVVFSLVNVKASNWDEIQVKIEKGEDSRALYNSMPTEIQKGDIISVKLVANNVAGWKLLSGHSQITWDSKAFEPEEVNGKYYTVISENISDAEITDFGTNKATIQYSWTNAIVSENTIPFIEFKFKVKNNVPDGVYKIKLNPNPQGDLAVYGNSNYYNAFSTDLPLQYLVGKPKTTSNYTQSDFDELDGGSYIIGSYLFTRDVDEDDLYRGVLTTEFIMLASKSIESNDLSEMIVYGKSATGAWKNAITNQTITMPDEIEITHINMNVNYTENGVYSDNDDKTILRLIQINDDKAIVTIENDKEKIHGVANISNRVATFTVGYSTYVVTITDNQVSIETGDNNLANKVLQKRANVTVEDYFNSEYAQLNYESDSASYYLKSKHTGKYTYGNYELYLLRISDTSARVCIKETNGTTCLLDSHASSNMGSSHAGANETTYIVSNNGIAYGLNIDGDNLEVTCISGECQNAYINTYNREKALSMQDVFDAWESNRIKYSVKFVESETSQRVVYIAPGETLESVGAYYEPYKHGYAFVEWRLNGVKYSETTPINGPITLEAVFAKIPGIPTLSISPQGEGHDYYNYEDNKFYYHLSIELEDVYEKFIIVDNDTLQEVGNPTNYGEAADVVVDAGTEKSFYARACIYLNDNQRYCGENSNVITLNPTLYSITFNTHGGTQINPAYVPYGATVDRPTPDPEKKYFVFDKWLYNSAPYDFTTPITGNITLDAAWTPNIPKPILADADTGDYYSHSLYLANDEAYCDKPGGGCSVTHDQYSISKYILFIDNGGQKTQVAELNPYDHYDFTVEPNELRVYSIYVVYFDAENTINSAFSDEFVIDSTIETPEIGYNTTLSAPTGPYDAYKWIEVTNLNDDFGINCTGNTCESYKVDGFKLYDYDGDVYNYIDTFNVGDSISVASNYNEVKHLYVRAYANNSSNAPVLGELSDELVFDTTILTPVIAITYKGTGSGVGENELRAFTYDDTQNAFRIDVTGTNHNLQSEDIEVDYEWFEKTGNNLTSIYDGGFGGEVSIFVPENVERTIVAKAYAMRGTTPVHSAESNEITIDLTNATYGYRLTEDTEDTYALRAYINDYEIEFTSIKINDVTYTPTINATLDYTFDKSIFESVDTITLVLTENKEVTANLLTN